MGGEVGMKDGSLASCRSSHAIVPRGVVPEEWLDLRRALAESVGGLADGAAQARRERIRLEEETARLRRELKASVVEPRIPSGVPGELREKITDAIRKVREGQAALLKRIDLVAEELEHAEENEDRFVVLVFGEVKSGKTALANHISGAEFDLPVEVVPPAFFVGDSRAERLEERPTEATREYQGFRVPGLLWIDCPGVLSVTQDNHALALRLVGRADFILLASSSDAPFKASEMRVLADLIEHSGNDRLDGRVLVTKADTFEEAWDDERGTLVRFLRPKPSSDVWAQQEWCLQQVRDSGLMRCLQDPRPHAVSIYLARDALGRDWETGLPSRTHGPRPDWRKDWRASGLAALCESLAETVRTEGSKLKAAWPEKRRRALDTRVSAECERAAEAIEALRATVVEYRSCLAAARREAATDAGEKAAAGVRRIFVDHDAFEPDAFDSYGAAAALEEHLRNVVTDAVHRYVQPVVAESGRRIEEAVAKFVRELNFEVEVETETETDCFRSRARGTAVGQALGGLGGAWGGARVGAALGAAFGPIGGVVGAMLGGFLGALCGSAVGAEVGGSLGEEEIDIEVDTGTNANQVIAATGRKMKRSARKAVRVAVEGLDAGIYVPLLEELDRVLDQVRRWQSTLTGRQLPPRGADARRRPVASCGSTDSSGGRPNRPAADVRVVARIIPRPDREQFDNGRHGVPN